MSATWGKNTLTNQALTMMNQALGISAITFTKAVTITDDITGDSVSQLQALTSVNYKQSRTPKAIATQDNKSRLGVTIDNSDVNEDYIYYGVGLYAKQNSTNQEVLFSVIPLTAGATMIAKENNATTASIYLDLYTDIVRGTQVTIMVSNSGTLSREDVQQMISQSIGNALNYPNETASKGTDFNTILDISITRIIKDTTVVNAPSGFSGTGYLTTIGSGDKTVPIMQTLDDTINNIRSTRYFNSTTNVWSEWNAYAKTVDVNQQLDKKVNVTDMRKPAGDVAGIEEVNAKQDKIGYTPADDSKVVHDNKDGTEQLNGVRVQPYNKLSDVINLRNIVLQTDHDVTYTAKGGVGEVVKYFQLYSGFSSLPSGTQFYYSYDLVVKNADGGAYWLNWDSPWLNFSGNPSIKTNGIHHFQGTAIIPDADVVSGQRICVTCDNSHATYELTNLMIVVGSIPVTHLPAPEDKVTDNKNGTIEVNGSSITPADDSKVAHLSGANNFDTVPTVKNNPLLLASSLPSDLARTGSDQEFTGKNTFDTAPIDKTTGNPYITKDGVPAVPSTLADTTKLANFTDGLQSGGKDVATTNQLPVINDTGWVKPTSLPTGWSSYTGGIRVKNNILYIHFFINLTSTNEDPQIVYPDISKILSGYGSIYKLPDDFQLMNKSGYGSKIDPCIWINYSFNGITAGKTGIVIQTGTTDSGNQWTGLDLSIPLETISS